MIELASPDKTGLSFGSKPSLTQGATAMPFSGDINYSFTPVGNGVTYSYDVYRVVTNTKPIYIPYWFSIC